MQGNAHKRVLQTVQTGKIRNCLTWFPWTKSDNFCFGDLLVAQKGRASEICARHVNVTTFFSGYKLEKSDAT
jgi:hypothetical protein